MLPEDDPIPEISPEEKQRIELQKMRNFTWIAGISTLLGILLFVRLGLNPWFFAFFIPTVIWFVMIFFYYFEKFLDRLKAHLDNRSKGNR